MSISSYFEHKIHLKSEKKYTCFAEKYSPTLSEVNELYDLKNLYDWFYNKQDKNYFCIYGEYGTGKTTILNLLISNSEYSSIKIPTYIKKQQDFLLFFNQLVDFDNYILVLDDIDDILKIYNIKVNELVAWLNLKKLIKVVISFNTLYLNKMSLFLKSNTHSCELVSTNYSKYMYLKCTKIISQERLNINKCLLKRKINITQPDIRSMLNSLEFFEIHSKMDKNYTIYKSYEQMLSTDKMYDEKCVLFLTFHFLLIFLNNIDLKLSKSKECHIIRNMCYGDIFHKSLFNANSFMSVDMYAAYTSIFDIEVKKKNITSRFGLIWTKQSSLYQKKKYIKEFDLHCNFVFSHIELYFFNLLLVEFIKTNKSIIRLFLLSISNNYDDFFFLKNSFTLNKNVITKKCFYSKLIKNLKS